MGAIVAAGLLSHVPSIMMPEAERRRRHARRATPFPRAPREIDHERIQPATFDPFIIFDTHWFTTRGFVVNAQEHLAGIYTSDELPGTLHDMAFDYRGDKMLGEAIVNEAQKIGLRCEWANYQGMALHYPTLNLMHHLNPQHQHRVLSVGVCQTASHERHLGVPLALGRAR